MYFLYVYKNRTMKPVKIVLRRGRVDERDDEGGESNKDIL
jgi:hypothetical protein